MRLGVVEVAVPDAQQAKEQRDVGLGRGGAEVFVDEVEAVEHLAEAVGSDGDHQRQTDRRVVGVAAADPVPELEHVGRVDAEVRHLLGVRRQRHEVPGDRLLIRLQLIEQPRARRGGVGDRLDGGEGLRGDDEQRLGRVQVAGGLVQVGAVDVRHEADGEVAVGEAAQHLVGHRGAQVGAADADVDDVLDAAAGVAGPLAGADPVREVAHLVEHGVHARYDVLPVDLDHGVPRGAQRGVQHGPVLGRVDLLAAEHGVPQAEDVGRGGEFAQQPQCLVGDEVLGVVDVQVTDPQCVPGAASGIGGEQLPQLHLAELFAVFGQRGPLGRPVEPGTAVCVHVRLQPSFVPVPAVPT
ncbi:hypothetical protein M2158_001913 [Streptomyces sp. SAI-144]|nr:hypothetical protein [Streptomyces sp. SAI-144]